MWVFGSRREALGSKSNVCCQSVKWISQWINVTPFRTTDANAPGVEYFNRRVLHNRNKSTIFQATEVKFNFLYAFDHDLHLAWGSLRKKHEVICSFHHYRLKIQWQTIGRNLAICSFSVTGLSFCIAPGWIAHQLTFDNWLGYLVSYTKIAALTLVDFWDANIEESINCTPQCHQSVSKMACLSFCLLSASYSLTKSLSGLPFRWRTKTEEHAIA